MNNTEVVSFGDPLSQVGMGKEPRQPEEPKGSLMLIRQEIEQEERKEGRN